jgi:hypothetical protein
MMHSQHSRKGVVLVAALATLSIVVTLTTTSIQAAIRGRHEVRKQLWMTQTLWLCEAGMQRAFETWSHESDAQEVEWNPTVPELSEWVIHVHSNRISHGNSISIISTATMTHRTHSHLQFRRSLRRNFALTNESSTKEDLKP